MKKIFTLVSLFTLSFATQAQWTLQNTGLPTGVGIQDMSIVSPQVAWAVADDNLGNTQAFTRTVNGGTTWISGTITDAGISDYTPTTISAIGTDTAWVALYGSSVGMGRIYKTTNGGTTWTRQNTTGYSNAASFLNIVHFFNGNNGVAIGDPINGEYEIYTTSNGGTTWTLVPAANIPDPLSTSEWGVINLYSAVGNTIWFGSITGRVFKSTDMGQNWTDYTTGLTGTTTNHAMEDIEFSDANNGIIRDGATIVKTTDGGATWTPVAYSGPLLTTDISGVPTTTNTFVSIGNGSSYTINNGTTWNSINTGTSYNHVSFFNPTTGWAGGITGASGTGGIYKWSGPALFASKDASVSSVTSPNSNICSIDSQNICVILSNNGLTPLTDIPVSYQIDAGATVTQTYTGTIQPGATAPFCFTTGHAFTTLGSYTITATTGLTADDNPANDQTTFTVTSNAILGFAASADVTICDGQSTTLSASGADNYTWMPGNLTGATQTVTPTTTTTYTATGSNTAGCTVTEEVTVTVVPTVPLLVTPAAGTICSGQSISISASGADTYSWSNGITGSTITVSPGSSTTYSVTGTIGASCSTTETVAITVNASPVAPIASPVLTICSGTSLNLSATGQPGDAYTWSGPVGYFSTFQNSIINNAGMNRAGNYTVTVTNAANCTTSGNLLVNVNSAPAMTISNTGPVCNGQTATITALGANNYSWSTGQTVSTITVTPTTTTTYTVYGTTGNCTAMRTSTVQVVTPPAPPALPANLSVCAGSDIVLYNGAAGNYNWTGPNTFSSHDDTLVITNASAVNGGVYQLVMSQGSCLSDPAFINLTVVPIPQLPALPAEITACENGSIALNPAAGPGTYQWSGPNGFTSTQTNPVLTNVTSANNGPVVVTVTLDGCVSSPDTININVVARPDSLFTFSSTGTSYTFTPVSGTGTFQWTFQGGLPATSTAQNPVVTFNTPGSHEVTLTVDNAGCSTSSSQIIQIGSTKDVLAGMVNVYPNPTFGDITIDLTQLSPQQAKVTVYNNLGAIVKTQQINTGTPARTDLNGLAAGSYVLQVQTREGMVMKQVILQR